MNRKGRMGVGGGSRRHSPNAIFLVRRFPLDDGSVVRIEVVGYLEALVSREVERFHASTDSGPDVAAAHCPQCEMDRAASLARLAQASASPSSQEASTTVSRDLPLFPSFPSLPLDAVDADLKEDT